MPGSFNSLPSFGSFHGEGVARHLAKDVSNWLGASLVSNWLGASLGPQHSLGMTFSRRRLAGLLETKDRRDNSPGQLHPWVICRVLS